MRLALIFFFPLALFGGTPEEILGKMSLEEKIGQLFVAPACPKGSPEHLEDWKRLLGEFHIGNVIVKQSDSEGPGRLLNTLQKLSKRPLLVLSDAEWGHSMTMDGAPIFPKNMTLGAVDDISLIERLGEEIGREAHLLGIHMNLSPVVDVNNNSNNPIIHMRSFGDKSDEVSMRSKAMIRGMKKTGLLTCAKHFPGHGDTSVDSHFGLPTVSHSIERLETIELVPFRSAIAAQVDAIMSGHILVKALDPLPATLSFRVMTALLREELGFEGLILTDALNMKALTDLESYEEIALKAHSAGAELLLYGDHIFTGVDSIIQEQIPRAYRALLKAYQSGRFSEGRLDESVLRILRSKDRFSEWIVEENPNLFTNDVITLQQQLYQAAITQMGPDFKPLDPDDAYLLIGGEGKEDLLFPAFCPCATSNWESRENVYDFDRVIVSLRNSKPNEKNCGFTDEQISFFEELSSRKEVIYCLFGTPYAAAFLPKKSTILIGYEEEGQEAVLNVLTGDRKAMGRLPVIIKGSPGGDPL